MLMDFGGALYRRYCSDITRTVVFGHASEEQKYMHQVVYEAQEAAFKVIRENANGKDADLAARNVIDSTKYKAGSYTPWGTASGWTCTTTLR